MDDKIKCMIYEYFFRLLDENSNELKSLESHFACSEISCPDDYVRYAFAFARKQQVEEIMRALSLILQDFDVDSTK